jgi:Arc/MetJ-type ribon-helix-helix transcriptional regulator
LNKPTPTKNKKTMKRIQFDFSPAAVDKLDEMVRVTGAASRAEVVRRALSLYENMLFRQEENTEVFLKKPDGTMVQIMVVP